MRPCADRHLAEVARIQEAIQSLDGPWAEDGIVKESLLWRAEQEERRARGEERCACGGAS